MGSANHSRVALPFRVVFQPCDGGTFSAGRAQLYSEPVMLPMWPFNRRVVAHRTFGQIRPVRSDQFWKASVRVESLHEPIELQIRAGEEGPSAAQEKQFDLLRTHFRKVLHAALRSLHQEYQRVVKAQPGVEWPAVSSLKEQLRATPLDAIWLEDAAGTRLVLSFRAAVDREQHFHIFFHHWKVVSAAAERF